MIPLESAHLSVFAATHPGIGGKNNEDNYAVSAYQISESDPTPALIAIIADGVGGHQAGEIASSLAVETISQVIAESDADQPLVTLEQAFYQANEAIYSQSISDSEQVGMSTTAACAWVIGDRLYISSVGDSRIFLIREERIIQVTIDHTWVQEAIESGILTAEQARTHPNAHLIRRHLGSKQPALPDFRLHLNQEQSDKQAVANQGMHLEPGDQLLLCSDGLTDLVSNEEIRDVMGAYSLEGAIQELIDLANTRGGHDNITIIGIQVPENLIVSVLPKSRSRLILALGLFVVVLVIFAGVWLYRMYFWEETPPDMTLVPSVTVGLSLPTVIPTSIPPTLIQTAALPTEAASPSPISSPGSTLSTPVQATYTPWPTSTNVP
ncbi:MAG: PP2C family serine/threonine-protein phosphatase [Anaerolineales bacterium]